jgi:NAD-dependent SIR2 family protein deacetylase
MEKDLLRSPPNCVLIAGTRVKVNEFAKLTRNVCHGVKILGEKGLVVYVNKEQQSFGPALDSLIDFRVRGDCDTFASLILANGNARY